MIRRIHSILLLFVLLIGGAGMNYVQAAKMVLTVRANNGAYGKVRIANNAWSGTNGQVQIATTSGTSLQISAQANTGYRFSKWNDNNTSATRTIKVPTTNTTYTATFVVATYTLTVTSNNTNYGTVTGGGTYNHSASATLTATPKTGYHFVQWSDGNTNATRTISNITANASYTATFAINQYTLTVSSNNTNYGTVTGGGTYNHGATANLKATPKTGYHFVKWNDNNTNASRSVTVTAAATYTATFAINQYTLTVKTATNNTTQGTVKINSGTAGASASATINHGVAATITATPATGYHFVKWNDNNTNASRSVTVTAAATYTATFAINTYTLQVKTATNNTTQGTVKINSGTAGATASATINHGSSATITATPATGYHFVKWNDNNTNASRSVTVTAAATYTATFAINTYTLTVNSNNTSMGTVTGGGTYNHGATATLTATPKGCYRFKQWNDGVTSSSRTVTVTQAKTYTATFEETTYSGNCGANGNNVTWSLNICTGVLTLSGSGAMSNWDYNSGNYCPWYSYKDEVKTVVIENGITNIGAAAFDRHFELTSITIPNSVTMIDGGAFYSCSKLTSITLPSTLTTIGNGSCCGFAYTQLTSITIPSNVTSIGQWSFCDISTLTDIYVSWTTANAIPTWWNMTNKSGIKLHVPCGTKSLYQAAAGWKNYTIVDDIASGTCGYPGNENNVTWSLSCDSVLTISGTGAMAHYNSNTMPWYAYRKAIKSVVIGGGVTNIGQNAFYACSSLTSVTLPSDFTSMGDYAFYGCGSLTSITIPSSTNHLGWDAFMNTGLTDVFVYWTTSSAIPYWNDLANTSTITLHVPCGTQSVYKSKNGWKDCNIVEEIASGTCGAEGGNLTWTLSCDSVLTISGTGAMVDYTGTEAPWYQYKASIRTVVVEEGVTTIGSHAFNQIQKITTVSFPNTLISVGDYAFWGGKLTSLPLPNSLVSIGYSAFAQNRATSLAIGSNVTSIGDNAFGVGSNLASIGVDPGNTVFDSREDCNALIETSSNTLVKGCKNTIIPNTVTSLNISAFAGNTQLTSITIPGSIAVIPNRAFSACTALASVVLEEGVQTINNEAFLNCTPLATVKLPSSLRNLGQRAFIGNSLTDMYVAWTENIPGWPFQFSIKTANLHVPCGTEAVYQAADGWKDYNIIDEIVSGTCGAQGNNVRWTLCDGTLYISGTGAMSNYPAINMPWKSHRASITSVVISDGVTSIGYNAFNGCSNLTSVTIPPSVTSIEQNAFYGCYAMESLYITDLAAWCNVEFGVSVEATPFMRNNYNSGSTEYLGGGNLYLNGTLVTTLTIPDGITEIKNLTFLGCSSITSIDFNQVTTIGSASFKGCHGLTSVTLPEGVTSLKNAFPYCTQLQSISIPASLTSLASQTLYHSDALTDIYVYWTDNIPGWPEYFTAKSPQPSITLHVPCGTEELYNTKANWKKYTIVNEMLASGTCGAEGDNLTWTLCDSTLTISGTGAMANYPALNMPWKDYRTSITSVIISEGVTTIGAYAFSGCSHLTSLTVPSSLTSVGQNAFTSCWAMESLYISDLEAWCNIDFGTYDSSPFSRNGYLIYVGGGDLYVNGTKVTTLTIPDGITEIKHHAFYGFAGITSIDFNQVTSIGNEAFNGCHGLSEVTIPEGVTAIGQYGFAYCSHLQSISIPASVSSLGTSMLAANNMLTDIHVHWTENIPAWPENFTKKNPQSSITLHIPCAAIELYQDADGWKDYTLESEGGPFTITVTTDDASMGDVSITVNP